MAPASKTIPYPCVECKSNCGRGKGDGGSLECHVCERWVHSKCANVSPEILKYIKENSSISFTCEDCKAGAEKLNKRVRAMNQRMEEIEKEVSSNRKDIEAVGNKVEDLSSISNKNTKDIKELPQSIEDSLLYELREREDRNGNLLFHNIAEANEDVRNGKARQEKDIKCLLEILDKIGVRLKVESVKFSRRIGEKKENCRPLLIGFCSLETSKEILEKAKNLPTTRYADIRIVPDLTKKQRGEEERMRREVLKRNSELDNDTAQNSEWKLVGPRGERRIRLVKKFFPRRNYNTQSSERNDRYQRTERRSIEYVSEGRRMQNRKRSRSKETPEKRKDDKRTKTNRDQTNRDTDEEDNVQKDGEPAEETCEHYDQASQSAMGEPLGRRNRTGGTTEGNSKSD